MNPMPVLRIGLASAPLAVFGVLASAGAAFAQFTPPPLSDPAPSAASGIPPASALPPAAGVGPGPVSTAPADPPPSPPPATVSAPVAVQAAPLQAPDLFSAEAASTGLPSDLWRGASGDLARVVIPLLAQKPLTPAAAAFARRVMSTGAAAPEGAGQDTDLAAARIGAVLALGDAVGARAMVEHTPGLRQNAALAQVAAEADLVLGREDDACAVGDSLNVGKDQPYFRRLRAYCLLRAGDKPGAQLAYDLTSEQAKDDIYKRLMGAAVSGSAPGDASLRNGMEYALSRRLQLDLTPAVPKAWAPIAPVLAKDSTAPLAAQSAAAARVAAPVNDTARASGLDPAVRDAALALADNRIEPRLADELVSAGQAGGVEAMAGAALYAAAGAPADARVRAVFATFDIGKSTASQARLLEMDATATAGARGDAALLALWLAADAGEAGPAVADRARIVRALGRAGFKDDARAYALEGMLSLRTPPPPPPPPPKKVIKKRPARHGN
jgi:hypothetical protein